MKLKADKKGLSVEEEKGSTRIMEKYRVIISPKLIEQIKKYWDYVANVKLSPETAERLVTAILMK